MLMMRTLLALTLLSGSLLVHACGDDDGDDKPKDCVSACEAAKKCPKGDANEDCNKTCADQDAFAKKASCDTELTALKTCSLAGDVCTNATRCASEMAALMNCEATWCQQNGTDPFCTQ